MIIQTKSLHHSRFSSFFPFPPFDLYNSLSWFAVTPFSSNSVAILKIIQNLLVKELFIDDTIIDQYVVSLEILAFQLVYVLFCIWCQSVNVGHFKREDVLDTWFDTSAGLSESTYCALTFFLATQRHAKYWIFPTN